MPVSSAIDLACHSSDFILSGRIMIEITSGREHPREEKCSIDRGQLALPRPSASFHVEEVIVEAFVSSTVRIRALFAGSKEAQRRQCSLNRLFARDQVVLNANWIRRQRHANSRNARRPALFGAINNQAVIGIDLVDKVFERVEL